jgi:hypothetical protein
MSYLHVLRIAVHFVLCSLLLTTGKNTTRYYIRISCAYHNKRQCTVSARVQHAKYFLRCSVFNDAT